MSGGERADLFVSYGGADVAWAEWIAGVLEEAEFTTILQAWDFRPGSNFVVGMHDALRRSDRVLLLMSESSMTSGFVTAEWASAFAMDPTAREGRLIPIRVGDFQPQGLLRAVVYIDLVGADEAEAKRRLLAGVAHGRAKPQIPMAFPGVVSPYPGNVPPIWHVPPRNPNFAGRDVQLDQLRAALVGSSQAVAVLSISGLGGVGKTQLAIEFAWRRAAEYALVWWVAAEVPATIAGSLAPLAERLGIATYDLAGVVALLHAELRRRDGWLLIFDNAEDSETLAPFLPAGDRGQVLVTSRNPAWRARGATLDVDVLPPADATAFLLRRTGSTEENAGAAVAAALGHLPLALEQAGAYVDASGMTLGAYRDLLHSRQGDLLAQGRPAFYRATVAATFGLAYERVVADAPAAAEVLGLCAFFAPDDIPTELVSRGDPLATEAALTALRRLSLIRRQPGSVAVHRLVGTVVRKRLGADDRANRSAAAAAALNEAFPNRSNDHLSWSRSARLLPHVLALAEYMENPDANFANLLNRAGVYLWARGQLRAAEGVLHQALKAKEAAYGADHLEVARTLNNLGLVLADIGLFDEAIARYERALRIKGDAFGPDNSEVARTLGNLGLALQEIGDIEGAIECQQRALLVKEAVYGPNHSEVARTLGNLGLALQALGQLEEAKEHLQRALRIEEGAYGPDHPEVARTLANLGDVLADLGDLHDAAEHLGRALPIEEDAYGPDHYHVARSLSTLGKVQHGLGELDEARRHLQWALYLQEQAHGPDHPEVARTLANLGSVLADMGDLDGAQEFEQRAQRILNAAYGAHESAGRMPWRPPPGW